VSGNALLRVIILAVFSFAIPLLGSVGNAQIGQELHERYLIVCQIVIEQPLRGDNRPVYVFDKPATVINSLKHAD
jgi:hypothetical protein